MLDGKVIAEFSDVSPWLPENNPDRYDSKIYIYLNGVQLAFQEGGHRTTFKRVTWIHHNPVVGNLFWESQTNDVSGQVINNVSNDTTFDPLGNIVTLMPSLPDFLINFSSVPLSGEPGNKCYADGVLSSCGYVYAALNNGFGLQVPPGTMRLGPNQYSTSDPSINLSIDWDNGYYGFVPAGAKKNKNGGSAWYDPNTGIEGLPDIPIERSLPFLQQGATSTKSIRGNEHAARAIQGLPKGCLEFFGGDVDLMLNSLGIESARWTGDDFGGLKSLKIDSYNSRAPIQHMGGMTVKGFWDTHAGPMYGGIAVMDDDGDLRTYQTIILGPPVLNLSNGNFNTGDLVTDLVYRYIYKPYYENKSRYGSPASQYFQSDAIAFEFFHIFYKMGDSELSAYFISRGAAMKGEEPGSEIQEWIAQGCPKNRKKFLDYLKRHPTPFRK